MLPRWHILWGAVFTGIIWITVPSINIFYLALVFFASFLIDIDHYLCSLIKTKRWSLKDSFEYHRSLGKIGDKEREKGIRRKGDFHFLHTIETHIITALIGFFWTPAIYIFLGMMFHSLLDAFYLVHHDFLYRREYLLFNWIRKKSNKA